MATVYVLIAIYYGQNIVFQEFLTKEKCDYAAEIIRNNVFYKSNVYVKCVEK